MKKYSKKDLFNVLIILLSFLTIFTFLIVNKGASYASRIDFSYQHYLIPEYFRTLFYENHQLFPSFAFNLGMGQNIYNFSYYGYFSPIILISYLLPFLKMKTYIFIASIIIYVLSVLLCYHFISNKTDDKKIRFICSFIFAMTIPLVFHTHRHFMFVCYIPFVFMGLFGVEKYIDKKKPFLLIVSNLFIITSSYFFSIPALISIFIYAIYLYLEKNNKFIIGDFIKKHIIISWNFILPVLMSSVLLIPSFKSIIDNRFKNATEDSIFSYLIPNVDFSNILYSSYSMGFSSIIILAIIYLIIKNKKSHRFLGLVFSCLFVLPIFNYILNGFMYINGKVFIPFIPLGILTIMLFLKDIFSKDIKLSKTFYILVLLISIFGIIGYKNKYVYILDLILVISSIIISKKSNKNTILIIVLSLFCFGSCLYSNILDNFNSLSIRQNQYDEDINILFENINNSDIYRTSDLSNLSFNSNNIRSINEYKTTMYSSITNKYYKDFYWNTFDTDNRNRNDAIFGDVSNVLFNIYFANKYLITDTNAPLGYKLIKENDKYSLYENSDVFSIGYVNKQLMSEKQFDSLDYPYNVEALLNYTIVKEDITSNYNSNLKQIDLKSSFDKSIKDSYRLNLKDDESYELKQVYDFSNKVLIIKFDMNLSQNCNKGDTYIQINDVRNTLTCKEWKYHNNNYSFTYVLSNFDELNIEIKKGKYDISGIKAYVLDYDVLKNSSNNLDRFIIDKKNTKGDIINGHVNVRENGYFNLSIPYDKGYNIYVDNKKTSYEKVNKSFIGFKIEKGKHNISIKYESPWLNTGKIVSSIGVCLFILTIIVNKRSRKNEKNINDSTMLQ